MSRKVVGWGTGEGVGCSILEPEQSTQIEESLARAAGGQRSRLLLYWYDF